MLLQLSDSHLMADPDARMLGVNTDASLRAVIDLARRQEGQPELMLLTGDLAQDGSPQAYRRLQAHLRGAPVRCLPGNHDAPEVMRQILADWISPVYDLPGWRIIMLDSTVPGEDFGHLDEAQLAVLDQAIKDAGPRHVLVALHHNLARVDGNWQDPMMVDNAAAVFARLSAHPQTRIALWGHIHQEFDCRHHHLRLLGTPSTCFQFTLNNGQHAIDAKAPGYRWIKLYADGSIATGIRRLDAAAWASLQATPTLELA
ncbi:phosphodiesterase [Bordetella avium]|nr:phosphodiesterase [Bordetella avium]AZY54439.1 phosphodiesterase [Bordetella avium]RIQ15626.1 phosphodiesterase [Bordetella avium]RIQ20138.1 phosphodiesterase [Bordetella avium]RIQ34729.1 phosphodiesterase [Bordetella avium]